MPRSQMAYDASATPLGRIFPQFLAMIVQFYGAGKAAAAIIAPAAAACENVWNCRAMAFCWPPTARRGLPTKHGAGAAYL